MINTNTKRETFMVFLLLAFCYVYFYHDPGWNGNDRLGLTFAIVEEGRLTIDSFHNQEGTFTEDKAFYNGHYYSSKAIGSSLIAVFFYFPVYRLEQLLNIKLSMGTIKYLLTFFSVGLPSALAGSLMYVLCKQVIGNRLQAYTITMAVNLGTMIFPFSVIFFGHQLAGVLLFGAFFLTYQMKVHPNYRRKDIFFLVGFLLGYAQITEYPVAPISLALTVYYFINLFKVGFKKRNLAIILPALGASIPVILTLVYNNAAFGNPISTGYSYPADPWFQQQQSGGFVGIGWPNPKAIYLMTIHPAFGIFWQTPVLVMSLFGIWFMSRTSKYRSEALIAITAFFSLLILYSGFPFWWGGYTFGPRYLVPMLAFMCFPLAFIPKRWFPIIVILGLISIIQMLIVVSSLILVPDDIFYQLDNLGYFGYSSIYSVCLKLLFNGEFSHNIGNQILGLNSWVSLVPILVIMLVITLFFLLKRDDIKSFPTQKSKLLG